VLSAAFSVHPMSGLRSYIIVFCWDVCTMFARKARHAFPPLVSRGCPSRPETQHSITPSLLPLRRASPAQRAGYGAQAFRGFVGYISEGVRFLRGQSGTCR
jgi:hypothetical protein